MSMNGKSCLSGLVRAMPRLLYKGMLFFIFYIQSQNGILWLSEGHQDSQESTLGLHWTCQSDTLSYKQLKPNRQVPTM